MVRKLCAEMIWVGAVHHVIRHASPGCRIRLGNRIIKRLAAWQQAIRFNGERDHAGNVRRRSGAGNANRFVTIGESVGAEHVQRRANEALNLHLMVGFCRRCIHNVSRCISVVPWADIGADKRVRMAHVIADCGQKLDGITINTYQLRCVISQWFCAIGVGQPCCALKDSAKAKLRGKGDLFLSIIRKERAGLRAFQKREGPDMGKPPV